jgi:hypothetical protein
MISPNLETETGTKSFQAQNSGLKYSTKKKTKHHGLSLRANYTERPSLVGEVIANFLQIEGATWLALRIPTAVFSVF